jgi:rubrerythrin
MEYNSLAVNTAGYLREAIIAELGAINQYESNIKCCHIKELKDVLTHIYEEEIEHYQTFLNLLRKYDHQQYLAYKQVSSHLDFGKIHIRDEDIVCVKTLVQRLRDDMSGEHQAILLYESHFRKLRPYDVKCAYEKIIADEKHHTEELDYVLKHLCL